MIYKILWKFIASSHHCSGRLLSPSCGNTNIKEKKGTQPTFLLPSLSSDVSEKFWIWIKSLLHSSACFLSWKIEYLWGKPSLNQISPWQHLVSINKCPRHKKFLLKGFGEFQVFQWLRLSTFTAEGTGSILVRELILQTSQCNQRKKKFFFF